MITGTRQSMCQILKLLFSKRLYPVWIAGQVWFGMANGGALAMQEGDHSWGGNANHDVTCCLNPVEFADPLFPDPKQPDPDATAGPGTLVAIQPADNAAGIIDHGHIHTGNPYLLYLLKRPPPALYLTV